MQHLDDGTIHAWLDGAVSAEEAGAIETHIADCGACAELVAEARGLVAGASRILTGLDHVPRGVIPGGAPAAPVAAPSRVRRWASNPALRAAAAVLFLASASLVVLSTVDIGEVGMQGMDGASEAAEADAATLTAPATVPLESPADAFAGAGAASPPVAEERPSEPASTPPAAKIGTVSGTANAPAAEPSPSREAPRARGTVGRAVITPTPTPTPTATPTPPVPAQASAPGADSAAASRTRAESVVVADAARRELQASSLRLQGITTTGASIARDTLAEQRIGSGALPLRQGVAGVEAQAGFERAFVGRPGVEMAGCYSVAVGRWSGEETTATPLVPPLVPPLLRLEATTLDIARDGPRLVLRTPADTAASRADSSYWRISARDSLLIVWRGAIPEVSLRLAIRDPSLEGVALHGGRTAAATATRVGATCDTRE